MKINNFRGDLSVISAKTASLLSMHMYVPKLHLYSRKPERTKLEEAIHTHPELVWYVPSVEEYCFTEMV